MIMITRDGGCNHSYVFKLEAPLRSLTFCRLNKDTYHLYLEWSVSNSEPHLCTDMGPRLDEEQSIAAHPRQDFDICTTHLANRSSRRASPGFMNPESRPFLWRTPRSVFFFRVEHRISNAVEWGMGFSVSFAMLACWSGRRALCLPLDHLQQRLLLGAWMYVTELPVTFRERWYLQSIREGRCVAGDGQSIR